MAIAGFDSAYLNVTQQSAAFVARVTIPRLSEEENLEQFGQDLLRLIDQFDVKQLLLDLKAVEYMTSAAVGKLITLHRRMHRRAAKLVLCAVTGNVLEVLRTSRLLDYFQIARDHEAALQELKPSGGQPTEPS
jgi:anti-sigma B factor antagonist